MGRSLYLYLACVSILLNACAFELYSPSSDSVDPATLPKSSKLRLTLASTGSVLESGKAVVSFGADDGNSKTIGFIATNTGEQNLTVRTFSLPSKFSLAGGQSSFTLSPGASVTFEMKMEGLPAGEKIGVFSIETDDGYFGGYLGNDPAISFKRHLDDASSDCVVVGSSWVQIGAGLGNTSLGAPQGSNGSGSVTWTFRKGAVGTPSQRLIPGYYQVAVTWVTYAPMDTAKFSLNGAEIDIDQGGSPAYDVYYEGVYFQNVGTPLYVSESTDSLYVRLLDYTPAAAVNADAVLLRRLP